MVRKSASFKDESNLFIAADDPPAGVVRSFDSFLNCIAWRETALRFLPLPFLFFKYFLDVDST